MSESEERIKTEAEEAVELTKEPELSSGSPAEAEGAPEEAKPAEASQQESDPYVGIQEDYEEPYLEPIEDEVKYVYQKGDFWAFLIAALRVFLPVLLLFFGGIMLVYWFFAR